MKSEIPGNSGHGTAKEFLYLYRLIRFRVNQSFTADNESLDDPGLPPDAREWGEYLYRFLVQNDLAEDKENDRQETREKRIRLKILLLIGLAPYIYPDLFDKAIENGLKDTGAEKCPRIGGVTGRNCPFFLPTGETVVFLIAGTEQRKRLEVQDLFGAEYIFWEKKILWLEDLPDNEPPMHGRVLMSQDYVDLLTMGRHKSPQFSITFPAKRIAAATHENGSDTGRKKPTAAMEWDRLVINTDLRIQIDEIRTWLNYNRALVEKYDPEKRFRPGFRTLFYGPPGTGKTYTAQLLGRQFDRDVYKIDLSMVVSKYIGETERNLELLFTRAEDKNWILFFDEADALFGKRTNVKDAHDKYANQEVSYLLQRIEDYNGLIILATNMKNNIDDAFIRRFNSVLKFPVPNAEERKRIWEILFPDNVLFFNKPGDPKHEDIPEKVKNYELTGGNINNIVHYACLKAIERTMANGDRENAGKPTLNIYLEDVVNGIKREMIKEGKPL